VLAAYAMYWLLVGDTVGFYAWLRHLGLGDVGLWLALWAGNILLSGAVVPGDARLGVDVPLMEVSSGIACRGLVSAAEVRSDRTPERRMVTKERGREVAPAAP
jgi:hypothetical protein